MAREKKGLRKPIGQLALFVAGAILAWLILHYMNAYLAAIVAAVVVGYGVVTFYIQVKGEAKDTKLSPSQRVILNELQAGATCVIATLADKQKCVLLGDEPVKDPADKRIAYVEAVRDLHEQGLVEGGEGRAAYGITVKGLAAIQEGIRVTYELDATKPWDDSVVKYKFGVKAKVVNLLEKELKIEEVWLEAEKDGKKVKLSPHIPPHQAQLLKNRSETFSIALGDIAPEKLELFVIKPEGQDPAVRIVPRVDKKSLRDLIEKTLE